MGVAVLNPQDCLKDPFSHMKHHRNPSACPNRQKKPVSNNRTRRSPPRNQSTRSSPSPPPVAPPLPPPRAAVSAFVPKGTVKKSPSNTVVVSQVRILKRGEEIPKETSDLVVENSDLGSTRRIGPDPGLIPSQIRLSGRKLKSAPFYAGPVTMTSPPPSDVPLPAFFTKKATNDLIRILRLDIA
ncbi:hypothetical protein ISN45_Aa07g008840 [Arabidopsis thaliana x Arabidopsis arenosa]|uniref:Uncharacterized protein n=1 Tax=Arabidopsis thaliana x Arabidopsis arenosa TaxID=1240361 RepID=A0A8T1Y141_9BRAS|nr:hypothetical protein ISN45_Aa07g008840 [Arabidopsis thaliana x Arabidopsis arenosa]